jgi:organic radical activating enzyme
MIEVELPLTYKCNWTCDYCLVDTHNQPDIEFTDLLQTVEDIEPFSEVTFSGGEPGLLPRAKLEMLISILKEKQCVIDLVTNGLFIKKHNELLSEFGEIIYHCVEKLTDDIAFPDLDQDKIIYAIVALNDDFADGSVVALMNRYPHIRFLLTPELRKGMKSDIAQFQKFVNDHKDRLHPRTMSEFIRNISKAQ